MWDGVRLCFYIFLSLFAGGGGGLGNVSSIFWDLLLVRVL